MWRSQNIWYHTHIWQENKSSVLIKLYWGAERVMFESMNSMLLHGSFDQPVGVFYSHFCKLFVFKWELHDSGFDTAFSLCFEVPTAFSKGMMFYFSNQALGFVTWWEQIQRANCIYTFEILFCIIALEVFLYIVRLMWVFLDVCFSLLSLLLFWDLFAQSLYTECSNVNR